MNKKRRRHSGWKTPQCCMYTKELIENSLFLDLYYDDWEDYRDGFRDWFSDNKMIKKLHPGFSRFADEYYKRMKMNKKQKMLLRRRRKRRFSLSFFN